MYPRQQGDVPKTYADVDILIKDYKYSPSTTSNNGLEKFINWYKNYENED